eukprot:454108_1
MQSAEDEKTPEECDELTPNFKRIVNYIQSEKCNKIVVLSGAGISVNAGIPDFRSKNGLFNTIDVNNFDLHLTDEQKQLILQQPEYIAHIELFKENPFPAYKNLSTFYTTDYIPTIAHYFIRLLYEHKLLKRIYTQNIDGLHGKSGIPSNYILPVHGTISEAKCVHCGDILNNKQFEIFKLKIINKKIPIFCNKIECIGNGAGLIKPNVIFYGEQLPKKYFELVHKKKELNDVDLLIIIGTSLQVFPVAEIVNKVPYKNNKCMRLVINKDKLIALQNNDNKNDIQLLGDADKICLKLIKMLQWENQLQQVKSEIIKRNANKPSKI